MANLVVGVETTLASISYTSIYQAQLRAIVNSVDNVNNTSNITVRWYYVKVRSDPYGAFNLGSTTNVVLNTNGVSQTQIAPFDLRSAAIGTAAKISEQTITVAHTSDGSKSISISGTHNTGLNWGSKSLSATAVLPTIPRKSAFTLNKTTAALNGSDFFNVTISPANSSFRHQVSLIINGTTVSSQSNITTFAKITMSKSWNSYFPTSISGSAIIRVITSLDGTQLGYIDEAVVLSVPSDIKATTELVHTLANNTVPADWGVAVQNHTGLTVKTNMTSSSSELYGATITKTVYSGSELNETITPYNTSYNHGVIKKSGNISLVSTAYDSRGRTTQVSKTIYVYPYSAPVINAKVYRSDSAGVEDVNGEYVTIIPSIVFSSVGGKNTIRMFIGSTEYPYNETLILPNFTTDTSHIINIEVQDSLSHIDASYTIPSGLVPLDIKYNGLSVAMGGTAEKDKAVEIKGGWDLYLYGNKVDVVVEEGSNANGFYRKWASGRMEQWAYLRTYLAFNSVNPSIFQTIYTWNYPVAFTSVDVAICTRFKWGNSGCQGTCYYHNTTSATFVGWDWAARSADEQTTIGGYAIGKWK